MSNNSIEVEHGIEIGTNPISSSPSSLSQESLGDGAGAPDITFTPASGNTTTAAEPIASYAETTPVVESQAEDAPEPSLLERMQERHPAVRRLATLMVFAGVLDQQPSQQGQLPEVAQVRPSDEGQTSALQRLLAGDGSRRDILTAAAQGAAAMMIFPNVIRHLPRPSEGDKEEAQQQQLGSAVPSLEDVAGLRLGSCRTYENMRVYGLAAKERMGNRAMWVEAADTVDLSGLSAEQRLVIARDLVSQLPRDANGLVHGGTVSPEALVELLANAPPSTSGRRTLAKVQGPPGIGEFFTGLTPLPSPVEDPKTGRRYNTDTYTYSEYVQARQPKRPVWTRTRFGTPTDGSQGFVQVHYDPRKGVFVTVPFGAGTGSEYVAIAPAPEALKQILKWESQPNTNLAHSPNWNVPGWSYEHFIGGKLRIVDDPKYGKVLHHEIEDATANPFRIYFDRFGNRIKGRGGRVRVPIWLSPDYVPPADGWASLFSVFYATSDDGGGVGFTTIGLSSKRIPYITAKKPLSGETYKIYLGQKPLAPTMWHNLDFIMLDGDLSYYLEDALEASGPMDPDTPFKGDLKGVHAGGYGVKLPKGAYVRNGPIEILWWS